MSESIKENQAADNAPQAEPQANGAGIELQLPEQIRENAEKLYGKIKGAQEEAEGIYKSIQSNAVSAEGRFNSLQNQLKSILEQVDLLKQQQNTADYQKRLRADYADWFSDLLRKLVPSGPESFERPVPLSHDTLIKLSRELSQQNFDCSRERAELDAIRQDIADERKNLEAVKTEIGSEQAELARVRADKAAAVAESKREKDAELAGIRKQIEAKQRELEDLNRQIGQARSLLKQYEAPSDDDFQGFCPPDDPKSGRIYLCGSNAFIDITGKPLYKNVLQMLDPDADDDDNAFRFMGLPQLVIRQLFDGRVVAKSCFARLPNKVDGKLLSCREGEETELRQGAVIEMTDRKGKTQTVKVYIAI